MGHSRDRGGQGNTWTGVNGHNVTIRSNDIHSRNNSLVGYWFPDFPLHGFLGQSQPSELKQVCEAKCLVILIYDGLDCFECGGRAIQVHVSSEVHVGQLRLQTHLRDFARTDAAQCFPSST